MKTELIDERVSLEQCKLAVDSLHAHEIKKVQEAENSELLPPQKPAVWLNVVLKQIPIRTKIKPKKIPIVHPLVDPRNTAVCLITKDPQREFKDLLEAHNIKFISRVVGLAKLKGKFKSFEARRMLLKENGLFLADDRVIPLLPKILGSKWFEAKKQPIPVSLTRKDLKGELERAISSTYISQNKGTCTSVKIGNLSQKPAQIVENLRTALPPVAQYIPGGWDNIQALYIKTNNSASLPIWSCTLKVGEEGRWDPMEETWGGIGEAIGPEKEDEQAEAVTETKQEGKKATQNGKLKKVQMKRKGKETLILEETGAVDKSKPKGKRRASEGVEEVPEIPQKKAKGKQFPSVTVDPSRNKMKHRPSSENSNLKETHPSNNLPSSILKTVLKNPQEGDATPRIAKLEKSQTKVELKQKRVNSPRERKKTKVRANIGRSTKYDLLGKKAGQ